MNKKTLKRMVRCFFRVLEIKFNALTCSTQNISTLYVNVFKKEMVNMFLSKSIANLKWFFNRIVIFLHVLNFV